MAWVRVHAGAKAAASNANQRAPGRPFGKRASQTYDPFCFNEFAAFAVTRHLICQLDEIVLFVAEEN